MKDFADASTALHDAYRSYCDTNDIRSIRARSIVLTGIDADSPMFPFMSRLAATPEELRMLFVMGYYAGRADAITQAEMKA